MGKYKKVSVAYLKTNQQTGKAKKTTEHYLVDAITNSEAEEKITEMLADQINGEFKVKAISESKVAEYIRFENGNIIWAAKMQYVDVDQESGKEKTVTNIILIDADTVPDAHARLTEAYKEMVIPYTITSVADSKIVGVFDYEPESETELAQ